jgi:hypothetical protein
VIKKTFWMLLILFVASTAYCSEYYVDPNGNDSNDGSIDHPFKTIPTAVTAASAGDTIYLRGVSHMYTTTINLSVSGTADAKYYMFADPRDANRPVLDFSGMADADGNRGIRLSGSYWYIKGLDIKGAGDNGMNMNGSNNIIEFCSFYENRDTGLQLDNGAANNEIINCDSYYNCDSTQGDADGFAPKLTVGTGNYFYGCRAWQNSDDGWDGYLKSTVTYPDDMTTILENCWCFKNGYLKSGAVATNGNGNGYKMGGSDAKDFRHNFILKKCLSFSNKAKGFDQNSNKGSMTLYNCTAFSNGGANYSINTFPLATGKTARVTNSVYFTGSNTLNALVVQTTDSWQSPFVVSSADFVNTNPAAAYGARKADGSLPDINFMHLAAGSDLINGGTKDANVTWFYYGSKPDLGYFEYGGCLRPVASDVNGNCQVDFFDFAFLANAWKDSLSDADLDNDGYINLMDLDRFATEWLTCNRDPQSECWK